MKNFNRRLWFIQLLIIGSYILTTQSQTTEAPITYQTSASTSSPAIYIITSFSSPGTASVTTMSVPQTSQPTSISTTPSITTNINVNGTYIITGTQPFSTSGTSQTAMSITTTSALVTTPPTSPSNTCCNNSQILLSNGTCISKIDAQISTYNILTGNSSNDTDKANALTLYITSITNTNTTSNSNYTLTVNQIDRIVGNLTNTNLTISTNNAYIVITQPGQQIDNNTIIGASFQQSVGGRIVDTANRYNLTNSNLSAAGIVSFNASFGIKSFNMFIINDPTPYNNVDNTSNRTLASSIFFATITRANATIPGININLYFKVLQQPNPTDKVKYLCAFFDSDTSQWNESGCTAPTYNTQFSRYECNCSHLTSFALVWLPVRPGLPTNATAAVLDAQDKASIAFQVISIVCFLAVLIHATVIRLASPEKFTQPRNLLPLISCAVTMILFIFWIAMTMTVYSRFSQSNAPVAKSSNQRKSFEENSYGKEVSSRAVSSSINSTISHVPCLSKELALMFIVYFLVIMMFCAKASVSFYNYLHFVILFPPPSRRNLLIMLAGSSVIAGIWVAFGAGFNSKPSFNITEVTLGKLCWFTRGSLHYFLTIPACIFLFISFVLLFFVLKHMIYRAENAPSDRSKFIRRRRCVVILLASCFTQGFGWVFGPIISVSGNADAAEVLSWFFIIFNGLEGFWAILLYLVVRNEGSDENERTKDQKPFDNIQDDTPRSDGNGLRRRREAGNLKNDRSVSPVQQLNDERAEREPEKLRNYKSELPHHASAESHELETIRHTYHGNDDERIF